MDKLSNDLLNNKNTGDSFIINIMNLWMFFVFFVTGITIMWELKLPLSREGKIIDLGFKMTDLMNSRIKNDTKMWSFFALINSIVLMYCNIYVFADACWNGWTPVVKGYVLLYWLRCLCGTMTRLPVPADIFESKVEIPPSGSNFFFLFSAHTMIITTIGLDHYYYYYNNEYLGWIILIFFVIVLFLQTLRLLVTRGHYSADIIIGFALSILMHFHTHSIKSTGTIKGFFNDD